jgi:CRISPR-associated protein Cas6
MVNLDYPVEGDKLPTDQGYALYSGLSRLVPLLHKHSCPVLVGPITGEFTGCGQLQLNRQRSRLRLRLPAEQIPVFLGLAGQSLQIMGCQIHLGVPQVRAVHPAPSLIARLVVIKGFMEPQPFLDACRRQLDALDVSGDVALPLVTQGTHGGKPRRRVLKIKEKHVVGFAVQITGLTAEESVKVQENGLGGRKKMGCGFFVPLRR